MSINMEKDKKTITVQQFKNKVILYTLIQEVLQTSYCKVEKAYCKSMNTQDMFMLTICVNSQTKLKSWKAH